jgi:hypothetical protein
MFLDENLPVTLCGSSSSDGVRQKVVYQFWIWAKFGVEA